MVARLQNASQVTWQRANSRLSVDWLWASIPLRIQPRSMREVAQLQFWPVDSISSIHRPTTILHAASSNQDRAHCSQPFPWASGPKLETFLPATISSPASRLASWLPKLPHAVERSSQLTQPSIRVVKFLPYPRAYSPPVQQALISVRNARHRHNLVFLLFPDAPLFDGLDVLQGAGICLHYLVVFN